MNNANLDAVCDFVCGMPARTLSAEVIDAAKQCWVDWFAVAIAALPDPAPSIVRDQILGWGSRGRALSLYGDRTAAAPAALVNGTLAHCLDYDDVHLGTACHASAPTLAAVLAAGTDRGSSELDLLKAFVAGFEVGTTMGGNGIGVTLADRGWHPTGILGHFSAVSAVAALLNLTRGQIAHALGLAATQTGGLQASGGSMAKPFHVGKAAMNGVMAAGLAQRGLEAETQLLDHQDAGILGCLFQKATLARFDTLGRSWQILRNSFKPYAACQLTHAVFEAGRKLARDFQPKDLHAIRAHVNPLAPKVASRLRPATPMEGKFSIPYCIALGLNGHAAGPADFSSARLADSAVMDLTGLVEVIPDEKVERWSSRVELAYRDGSTRAAEIDAALGSLTRPLAWPDLEAKFMTAVEPILRADAARLLAALRSFEAAGRAAEVAALIERNRAVFNARRTNA